MNLAIAHYLSELTERGELDLLLRNLLIADGYEVIKRASRGEKEYGVDVVARRREGNGQHLYLFQVKRGDLDRAAWSEEKNGVRVSLEDAVDEPYVSFAKFPRPPARRHIIVVFNGDLKEDVRRQFDGFIKKQALRHPDLDIDYWNLSTLVTLVERALFDEGLVPTVDAALVKKALAFADVPAYEFREFRALVAHLTAAETSKRLDRVRRLFATVRVVTRMMAEYARRGGAFRNAVLASEIAVLALADWCQRHRAHSPGVKDLLYLLLEDYREDLKRLVARLEPSLELEHGLLVGELSELVEYPLRTFEILGFLATHVLLALHLGEVEEAQRSRQLMTAAVNNNPAARRPLLDNHGVDIALVALALAYAEREREVARYALGVLDNLYVRVRLKKPLPELLNNVNAVVELLARGRRPIEYEDGSSTLVPLLFELLLFGDGEVFGEYARAFDHLNLQTWYPPAGYVSELFHREMRGGTTETGVRIPDSPEAFLEAVEERYRYFGQDRVEDEFSQKVSGIVVYIACRHFRTPLFPSLWREWLIPEPDLATSARRAGVSPRSP